MNENQSLSKEERILSSMQKVLTRVIRETATPPGLKHPLSENCINDMRECLVLISTRKQELAASAGRASGARPRYIDEPRSQGSASVPIEHVKPKDKDPQ
jgi:hypothetical protein